MNVECLIKNEYTYIINNNNNKYSGLDDKCVFQPIAVESLGVAWSTQ